MRTKMLWTLPVIVLAIVLGGAVKTYAGIGANVRGWLWGGSDSPASIGWISTNNVDKNGNLINPGATVSYGVNIPSSNGPVSGYAWNGNYGWISFNGGDLAGCPQAAAARSGNKLTGGARILSIRDGGSNAGGWLGCISLSGPGYGVTVTPSGQLQGYAWSGERDLGGGRIEGLGWIDFSKASLANVLKICPSTLTLNQGSSQVLTLYNDQRQTCGEAGTQTPVAATSWSESVNYISLSPLSGQTTTVQAVLDGVTSSRSTQVTATDANGRKVTAAVTVAALLPVCSCNATTAVNTCSTQTFPGTEGQPCQTVSCSGTKDCGANWKEIPPTN